MSKASEIKAKHPRAQQGYQFVREVGPFPVYINKETGRFALLMAGSWYGTDVKQFDTIPQAQAWVDERLRGEPVEVWSINAHNVGRMSQHTVIRDTTKNLWRDVKGGEPVHWCVVVEDERVLQTLTDMGAEYEQHRERMRELDAEWQTLVQGLKPYEPEMQVTHETQPV